jgi:hypothetical protein
MKGKLEQLFYYRWNERNKNSNNTRLHILIKLCLFPELSKCLANYCVSSFKFCLKAFCKLFKKDFLLKTNKIKVIG